MHDNCSALIDQVIALRKEKRISQVQLAKMVGLSQPSIARIEQKRVSPTIETLCRILEAMDSTLVIEEIASDN